MQKHKKIKKLVFSQTKTSLNMKFFSYGFSRIPTQYIVVIARYRLLQVKYATSSSYLSFYLTILLEE